MPTTLISSQSRLVRLDVAALAVLARFGAPIGSLFWDQEADLLHTSMDCTSVPSTTSAPFDPQSCFRSSIGLCDTCVPDGHLLPSALGALWSDLAELCSLVEASERWFPLNGGPDIDQGCAVLLGAKAALFEAQRVRFGAWELSAQPDAAAWREACLAKADARLRACAAHLTRRWRSRPHTTGDRLMLFSRIDVNSARDRQQKLIRRAAAAWPTLWMTPGLDWVVARGSGVTTSAAPPWLTAALTIGWLVDLGPAADFDPRVWVLFDREHELNTMATGPVVFDRAVAVAAQVRSEHLWDLLLAVLAAAPLSSLDDAFVVAEQMSALDRCEEALELFTTLAPTHQSLDAGDLLTVVRGVLAQA